MAGVAPVVMRAAASVLGCPTLALNTITNGIRWSLAR
jgi:hypothetical protein